MGKVANIIWAVLAVLVCVINGYLFCKTFNIDKLTIFFFSLAAAIRFYRDSAEQ